MPGMTAKQAAAELRKALNMAASPTGIRFGSDGHTIHLDGLHFDVRATKSGVNVTIHDQGYVRRVAELGDPRRFSTQQRDKVTAEVEGVRARLFNPPLPGKTQWGPIIISARATTVTHMGSRDKVCDRCGSEVREWREVAGTPLSLREQRPEIMCVPCNREFMNASW